METYKRNKEKYTNEITISWVHGVQVIGSIPIYHCNDITKVVCK